MSSEKANSWSRWQWLFYGLLIIAGLLLFSEHRTHVLSLLFYSILLICPLMHFFMHRGHGSEHK